MTIKTYFFVHHTGNVYRKDVPVSAEPEHWTTGVGRRLVALSNLVVVMNQSGTGRILKCREYRREDLTRDEMVVLSLQAESI